MFTKEQIEKAKTCKSVEALLKIAKQNNVELTEEDAAKFFAELNKSGELADEELDNVSGGCGEKEIEYKKCPGCKELKFREKEKSVWVCDACGFGFSIGHS